MGTVLPDFFRLRHTDCLAIIFVMRLTESHSQARWGELLALAPRWKGLFPMVRNSILVGLFGVHQTNTVPLCVEPIRIEPESDTGVCSELGAAQNSGWKCRSAPPHIH